MVNNKLYNKEVIVFDGVCALCNNFVIGYTGKAGDEYFKLPLFCKIEYGDITTFVSKIINLVKYEKFTILRSHYS